MSRVGIVVLLAFVACKPSGIVDLDGDGWFSLTDCNDGVASINPGMIEIPGDFVDNDCNPSTRDDDLDQDGVLPPLDCEPLNPFVPAAREVPYDGLDNDCDPRTPDDDLDEDGWPVREDCDDSDPFRSPDQEEVPYDGLDNDCNAGTRDDDLDGDGVLGEDDCDDLDPTWWAPRPYYQDCDGDGFAPAQEYFGAPPPVVACEPPPSDCRSDLPGGWTLVEPIHALTAGNTTTDCNDADATAYPDQQGYSQLFQPLGNVLAHDYDCDGQETTDHGQFVCYPVPSTSSCFVTPGYDQLPVCGATMAFASDCAYVGLTSCEMANVEYRTVTCQ